MKSPIAMLSLLLLTAACGDNPSYSPDPPGRKVVEGVRACVSNTMDWSRFRATGVMPETGDNPKATLRTGDVVRDTTLPPGARVRFIISKIISTAADGPVDDLDLGDVELRVENGDGESPPEVAYFHEEGVTPYNEGSQPLEDCEEVEYYDDTFTEPPVCVCDSSGNDCYVWGGGKGGPDISEYHCDNPDDFMCYASEKAESTESGAFCYSPAEKVE